MARSSGTTLSCTVATEAFDVNGWRSLWFAGDDAATADTVNHNNLLLTSVTDNAPTPNIWTVQRCFTNTEATSAANGATVCVATARITSAIPVGGTITATFGTTTAKAIVVREFTVAAGECAGRCWNRDGPGKRRSRSRTHDNFRPDEWRIFVCPRDRIGTRRHHLDSHDKLHHVHLRHHHRRWRCSQHEYLR